MIRKFVLLVGLAGILLLNGCAPIQPNLNRGEMKFVKGKAYYIPSYTCWTQLEPEINAAAQAGICKKNGIMWLSEEYVDKYNFPCKIGVSDIIISHAQSIKQNKSIGLTGCVYPLTNQEYQYRVNEQNQASSNHRASKVSNAIEAPKTYNVNYTGTVFHY